METIELDKQQRVNITSVVVYCEDVKFLPYSAAFFIGTYRIHYEGRTLDQIEKGGNYFFDINTCEVVKVEL